MRSNNTPDGHNEFSFIEKARRKQIIDSTIETLAEIGYMRTSLDKIAQRAGISKGVILYHFKNKENLILETAQAIIVIAAENMRSRIETENTSAGKLKNYIASNLAFMQAWPEQLRALIEIIIHLRTPEGKLYFDAKANEPALAELEGILKIGQENGEFREFSPRVMATAIRGSIDAVASQFAFYPDLDIAVFTRELVDIFDQVTRKK
jgi:TetR/AcrR family transcriptional regulator, fatty acid metabolism regulator protein